MKASEGRVNHVFAPPQSRHPEHHETQGNIPDQYFRNGRRHGLCRLFSDEEPLGKTLQYNRTVPYTVTGVIEDIRKFHLKINAFASVFDIVRRGSEDFLKSRSFNFPIYLKITPGTNIEALEEKINARVNERGQWEKEPLFLRPFNDIYFTRNLVSEKNMRHGNMNLVIVFSIIAVRKVSGASIGEAFYDSGAFN